MFMNISMFSSFLAQIIIYKSYFDLGSQYVSNNDSDDDKIKLNNEFIEKILNKINDK